MDPPCICSFHFISIQYKINSLFDMKSIEGDRRITQQLCFFFTALGILLRETIRLSAEESSFGKRH